MSSNFKTPGVYIVEKEAFPNSVVEVPTAVPCFIGYTEKAPKRSAYRITSFYEYLHFFGGPPAPGFLLKEVGKDGEVAIGNNSYVLQPARPDYLLYRSMQLFYQNGGNSCYIVSLGDYTTPPVAAAFTNALAGLEKEWEITMVLAPDALLLDEGDYYSVTRAMLQHCDKMQSRIAILDVYNGHKPADSGVIGNFRNNIGTDYLKYGAAYYPFLNTNIENTASYDQITNQELLDTLLQQDTGKSLADIGKGGDELQVNKKLAEIWPAWKQISRQILQKINLLPPAPAIAGIYTTVDKNRGVWKAPANVSLASVISPAVNITHDMQEDLNVPLNGKAINAIRSFIGEGVLVWGARTLDANSQDWRYINVRRTMIMLEQSIKAAARAFVFEPNDANTWITVKSMIHNFLTNVWKAGGLTGASADDAFSVNVGLGTTMTPDDILEGIMRITVLVAIVRPAEFIEITFQQQMQKS